ncbi:MAG: hypothetical protein ACRCYY_06725 [Trueperaceae bacterium]
MKPTHCKQGQGKQERVATRPYIAKLFLFLIPLCSFLFPLAFATTYKTLTLDEMIAQTELAFMGTVTSIETIAGSDGDPWTRVTFQVSEALLATEDDANVTLSFYGGTLSNGVSVTVNLMPQFREQEEVLILAYNQDLYSPIVGFRQGLWRNSTLGLRDEIDRALTFNEDGTLALGGAGGSTADILQALREALENRGAE